MIKAVHLILAGNLKQGKEYALQNNLVPYKVITRKEDCFGWITSRVKLHKTGTWYELNYKIIDEVRARFGDLE